MQKIHEQTDEVKAWILNELHDAREKGIKEGLKAVYDFIERDQPTNPRLIQQEIDLALSNHPYKSRLCRRGDSRS